MDIGLRQIGAASLGPGGPPLSRIVGGWSRETPVFRHRIEGMLQRALGRRGLTAGGPCRPRCCRLQPFPFSPQVIQLDHRLFNNPLSGLRGIQEQMSGIGQLTDRILERLEGQVPGNPGGQRSAVSASLFQVGHDPSVQPGDIDRMLAEAQRLLRSDQLAERLRGQMLVRNTNRLFRCVSHFIQVQSDMTQSVIRNIGAGEPARAAEVSQPQRRRTVNYRRSWLQPIRTREKG